MGLPWWAWALVLIVAIVLAMRSALKGFRRRTRREYIEVLKEVARTTGGTGYRLLDRPLKVGHEGIEVV
jgi:hypothetical protein